MTEQSADTSPADDAPASRRPAVGVRRLARTGPGPAPPGAGPLRRLARRLVLRLIRPYSAYQQSVDDRLLEAIEDLDSRLREQEGLKLGLLAEDLIEALESLRSRVAAGEDVV